MKAPTLDYARALGLVEIAFVCSECGEEFSASASAMKAPPDTPLERLPGLLSIRCRKCSGLCRTDLDAMGLANDHGSGS
ncbi:MAG: hypothetical protein U1E28_20660 [Beijerinckiaceae bacterium]